MTAMEKQPNLEYVLRESLRRAQALRGASRIKLEARRRDRERPFEDGLDRIRDLLIRVREAESVDSLVNRDRLLDGLIIGASLFGGLPGHAIKTLHDLRENAFSYRCRELARRYNSEEQ